MSLTRRNRIAAWSPTTTTLSAAALVALAGCVIIHKRAEAGVMKVTEFESAPAPPAADTTSAFDKPGSYAVIDAKKAAIPEVAMGDPETVARIIDEGKHRNRVMDHLTHISNEIGTRLTGSSNLEMANKYARDQFEKWGLSIPAFGGAEGQTSTDPDLRGLWQWNTVAVRFDRGPSTAKIVAIRNPASDTPEYRTVREMEFTTLSWASGTNGPVRAPVVKAPENDEQFAAVKDKVKGSWILVKPNLGGRRGIVGGASARLQLFANLRKKWKGASGEDTAAAAPAVDKDVTHYEGTISGGPFPDTMPLTLDMKMIDPKAITGTISLGGFRTSDILDGTFDAEKSELKFRTEGGRGNRDYVLKVEGDTIKGETVLPDDAGKMSYSAKKVAVEEPKKGPTMEERLLELQPAGWILASSSELVLTGGAPGWSKLDLAELSPDVIVTVRQSDYDCMNSRLADGAPVEAEFDLKNTFVNGPIPVYDTIAEITGTEFPDEVVIVSGHLDSWDGPGSRGTTDNATGSAVTMEAARILAAAMAKPKRTIRFILWTGEEQGLLGSTAYVKYLKEQGHLDKISAVFVDDGGTNYEGGLSCVESQVPYLAAATAPVNGHFFSEVDNKFMDVNIHAGKTFTQVMGSDHASFMREKVPGFFWDEIGRSDYNHMHHTQYDRLDMAIPEYLHQSATCAAVTAYNLACAPTLLPRPADDQWPAGRRGGAGGGRRDGPPGNPASPATPGDSPARPSGTPNE